MPSIAGVLLVEDDQACRDEMAETINELGYEVSVAANGELALERLRSANDPPWVILLDLRMPVMDGWQFRDELRKDPLLADIPVVVLSGDPNLQGFDADAHLMKPVHFNPLLRTLERLYRGASAAERRVDVAVEYDWRLPSLR
jgi:CheY-like chemotaxis protein